MSKNIDIKRQALIDETLMTQKYVAKMRDAVDHIVAQTEAAKNGESPTWNKHIASLSPTDSDEFIKSIRLRERSRDEALITFVTENNRSLLEIIDELLA